MAAPVDTRKTTRDTPSNVALLAAAMVIGGLGIAMVSGFAAEKGHVKKTKMHPAPLADRPANQAFGAIKAASTGPSIPIGGYAMGCIAGAKKLPATGQAWQAMRLSRNRSWGHPLLISYIEKLATDAQRLDGWPGLLVGDMAQPLGGPMLTGHASHQIGLDVDIWFKPMPTRVLSEPEREDMSAENMIEQSSYSINKSAFGDGQVKLLKRAASSPQVARIFVNPIIKKELCQRAGTDKAWLGKVRPWWGHSYHFHVRLKCPAGNPLCKSQPEQNGGDGCGAELEEWIAKLKKPPAPKGPTRPVMLSQLPNACRDLLQWAEKSAPVNKAAN